MGVSKFFFISNITLRQKIIIASIFCLVSLILFAFSLNYTKISSFDECQPISSAEKFSKDPTAASSVAEKFVPPTESIETKGLKAPDEFAYVVGKIQYPFNERFSNLYYEGNNKGMRGEKDEFGFYAASGEEVSKRWVGFARGTQGVFLLRDSLWSQQDHVVRQKSPKALILPPSWITAAVVEVANGGTINPVALPAIGDDNGWFALAPDLEVTAQERQFAAEKLFNPFPLSEDLFNLAVQPFEDQDKSSQQLTQNARITLHLLNTYIRELCSVQPKTPQSIAKRGAEIIARSDREYFGADARCAYIIPLLVENPYYREILEGKGFVIDGRDVPESLLEMVRTAVLRRRLEDGDIAIERYDVSLSERRAHIIKILEVIVPFENAPSGNHRVWVWVTGPTDQEGRWKGPNAVEGVKMLHKELANRDIDMSRVRFISKIPSLHSPDIEQLDDFKAAVKRFNEAKIWLRFNINTKQIKALIEQE